MGGNNAVADMAAVPMSNLRRDGVCRFPWADFLKTCDASIQLGWWVVRSELFSLPGAIGCADNCNAAYVN